MINEDLKTIKIYYEFRDADIYNTTIEFEEFNPEENTFKFTICSEYLNSGKKNKVKYKEIRTDLDKVYRKLKKILNLDSDEFEERIVDDNIYYALKVNDFKVSNYSDRFLQIIEKKFKFSKLTNLKITEYTKTNIDNYFNTL